MPPTIAGGQDTPTERKVVLSQLLTLQCEAGGHPPPSLSWLKDGVPVRDGHGVRVLQQGRTVEIASASVSDAGRYVCLATSVAGEKEIKYDVSVLGGSPPHTHTQTHVHTHTHTPTHEFSVQHGDTVQLLSNEFLCLVNHSLSK